MINLVTVAGFDWDDGNREKSSKRHGISAVETEEVFFNEPLIISEDTAHSQAEERWQCLGRTNDDKKLFISFTTRNNRLRVISARLMSRKERIHYEKAQKDTTI